MIDQVIFKVIWKNKYAKLARKILKKKSNEKFPLLIIKTACNKVKIQSPQIDTKVISW